MNKLYGYDELEDLDTNDLESGKFIEVSAEEVSAEVDIIDDVSENSNKSVSKERMDRLKDTLKQSTNTFIKR